MREKKTDGPRLEPRLESDATVRDASSAPQAEVTSAADRPASTDHIDSADDAAAARGGVVGDRAGSCDRQLAGTDEPAGPARPVRRLAVALMTAGSLAAIIYLLVRSGRYSLVAVSLRLTTAIVTIAIAVLVVRVAWVRPMMRFVAQFEGAAERRTELKKAIDVRTGTLHQALLCLYFLAPRWDSGEKLLRYLTEVLLTGGLLIAVLAAVIVHQRRSLPRKVAAGERLVSPDVLEARRRLPTVGQTVTMVVIVVMVAGTMTLFGLARGGFAAVLPMLVLLALGGLAYVLTLRIVPSLRPLSDAAAAKDSPLTAEQYDLVRPAQTVWGLAGAVVVVGDACILARQPAGIVLGVCAGVLVVALLMLVAVVREARRYPLLEVPSA